MTKRLMSKESDAAHKEIEAFLRSGSGQSLAQVAVILGVHRAAIQGYSSDLQGFASQYTMQFTNHFKEGPGGGPKLQQGRGRALSRIQIFLRGRRPTACRTSGRVASPVNGGDGPHEAPRRPSVGPRKPKNQETTGGGPYRHLPRMEGPPRPSHNPLTSLMGGGLPSLPSMPGGGLGWWDSDGPVAGADGRVWGVPGWMAPPAGLGASGLQGSPVPSLGMDFGRGLAAGASAAGAVPPVPQAPLTSLAAPVETAPVSAAPAAAPVPTASSAAVSAPAPAPAPAAGVPAGGLTSMGRCFLRRSRLLHRRLVRRRLRRRFLLRPWRRLVGAGAGELG